jgi:uncharacterized integral membrane protein
LLQPGTNPGFFFSTRFFYLSKNGLVALRHLGNFQGFTGSFQSCRALQRSQKLQAFTELILFAGVILCFNVKNANAKSFILPTGTTSSPARDAYILSILYGIWSISGGK